MTNVIVETMGDIAAGFVTMWLIPMAVVAVVGFFAQMMIE